MVVRWMGAYGKKGSLIDALNWELAAKSKVPVWRELLCSSGANAPGEVRRQ